MNGLIQHLATSGLNLSEDNILGASSNNNTSIYEVSLPNEYYVLAYGGDMYSYGSWAYCWGVGLFKVNKSSSEVKILKQIIHANESGRKVRFAMSGDVLEMYYVTVDGSIDNTIYPSRLFLKSI